MIKNNDNLEVIPMSAFTIVNGMRRREESEEESSKINIASTSLEICFIPCKINNNFLFHTKKLQLFTIRVTTA